MVHPADNEPAMFMCKPQHLFMVKLRAVFLNGSPIRVVHFSVVGTVGTLPVVVFVVAAIVVGCSSLLVVL